MKQVPTTQGVSAGMFTDVDCANQPKNTTRFVLNGVIETEEGDLLSLSTESGNELCITLEDGQEIIGSVFTSNNKQILFITDDTDSKIVIQTDCESTTIIDNQCLNFKKHKPISAISRVVRGCDTVVYFTDNYNDYRSINIDRLDLYLDEDGNFDCDLTSHFPGISYPSIEATVNDQGGSIPVGVLQFAVQYLDASFNEIEWSFITNPVAIYDENISSNYGVIDGAWNGASGIRPNGVPLTRKSVSLNISNLDQRYAFIRIAAIESSEGLASVTNVYYTPEIPISSQSIEYVYTGEISNYTIGSLLDIQTPRPYINTVAYHTQLDNKLIIAGTTSPNYDFCGFQKFANDITSKFTVKRVDARSQFDSGNPKDPSTWYKTMGFAADEIYAFGIVYVFKSGYHSPVFHIPGRASMPHDMLLKTVGTSVALADVRHTDPNINVGDTIRQWRYSNTALLDGTMSFWRADNAVYPSDTDCDGGYVYGELTGQEIRHHKFPDRKLFPLYESTGDNEGILNVYGIQFDNVTYPHEDIVNHYFVYVKRDEFNRTVFDRGIIAGVSQLGEDGEDGIAAYAGIKGTVGVFIPSDGTTSHKGSVIKYISPKTLMNKEYMNGNYFHIEGRYDTPSETSTTFDFGTEGPGNPDVRIMSVNRSWGDTGFSSTSSLNRTYNQNIYLVPNSIQTQIPQFPFNKLAKNRSHFNWVNLYNLEDNLAQNEYSGALNDTYAILAANKIYRDVNTDLAGLVYSRLHNNLLEESSVEEIYGGDIFISAINLADCDIKGEEISEFDFVSQVSYESGLWVESEINFYMRHGTNEDCGSYYKSGSLGDYFLPRLTDLVDGEYIYKLTPCEEGYNYNKDYSKRNVENILSPLDRRYECCARCLEKNVNRIWYSIEANPSNQDDGYRIILPNNSVDLYGEDIEITDLFVHMDNLYARTQRSLYLFPTREQTIQSNENAIYLGTGEFLSIKPRRIITTDYGYAGGTDQFARVTSEFGTTFIDRNSKRIFNLTGLTDLKELTTIGINNDFQKLLKLNFLEDWATISSEEYPFNSTTSKYGIGFRATYDPRLKRYILTKRDYKYIAKPTLKYANGVFFVEKNQAAIPVSFDDPAYFENKSFTISFAYTVNSWISYHSYLPKYMYNDILKFYTSDVQGIWKHNIGTDFLTFYGNKYPFIVDLVVNDDQVNTFVTDSIFYTSKAKEFVGDFFNTIEDVTFNALIGYNDHQTTGYQEMAKQGQYDSINNALVVSRVQTDWKVNGLFNYRTNHTVPMFTNNWSVISDDYFIDKKINLGAVSSSKNIYELDRLRDKYFGLRLFYNPNDRDIKLVTNIVATLKRYSVR